MKKQFFTSNLRLHFNLRKPQSLLPTMIYAVVCIQGRQYRYSTGMKVFPADWEKKKMRARILPEQSSLTQSNNRICNERLDEFHHTFEQIKKEIEQNSTHIEGLSVIIGKRFAKIGEPSLPSSDTLCRPLSWLEECTPPKPTYESAIRQFVKWVSHRRPDHVGRAEIDMDLLREYELFARQKYSASRYNMLLLSIRLSLEKAMKDPSILYSNIEAVQFLKNCHVSTHVHDDGRIALTSSQVDILYDMSLTGKEAEVRDMFVFQCFTSLRFSNISGADFSKHRGESQFEVVQVKEKGSLNQTVSLLLDARIGVLLDRHGWKFPHYSLIEYNRKLESIIEKTPFAMSTVAIKTKRADGTTHVKYKTMAQAIRSHNGRRTFITQMRSNPLVQDRDLMRFTGHATIEMLQNYDKTTRQKAIDNVVSAVKKKTVKNKKGQKN